MAESFELHINKWMEELIDRSKRNQLLYFTPSKTTSLRIIEEAPARMCGILINGAKMGFLANEESKDGTEYMGASKESEVELPDGLEKHDYLQTELPAAELDRRLLVAARRSATFYDNRGVNALFLALGFLEWRESANSDDFFRAPLVLVPVRLERCGVARRHTFAVTEEGAFFNPALALACMREHKIAMPAFNPDAHEFDPNDFFNKISETINWLPGWRLLDDIFLSMFSFSGYELYKDLDDHRYMFHENELVKALCGKEDALKPLEKMPDVGMFDRGISPDRVFQVTDADSSQQEAIEAVKRGASLVIKGPPGTGKSQTITNIISESMAAGKKVLFISGKAAALKAVRKRLEACGLGDFCLELHVGKTNRREVASQLGRTYAMAGEQPSAPDTGAFMKLNVIRETLNSYPAQLHETKEPLGYSLYRAFGRLAADAGTTNIQAAFPDISKVTAEDYVQVRKEMATFAEALVAAWPPSKNPWIGVKSYDLARQQQQAILNDIKALLSIIPALKQSAAALRAMGAPPGDTFPQLKEMKNIAALILNSPRPDRKQISDPRWAEQAAQIAEVIALGEKQKEKRRLAAAMFNSSVFTAKPEALTETINRMGKNPLRFVTPSYWAVRRLLRALYKDADAHSFTQAADDLRAVSEAMQGDVYIRSNDAYLRELFGPLWDGIHSDWAGMRKHAGWMESFQRAVSAHPGKAAFETLCVNGVEDPQLFADAVNALDAHVGQFFTAWKKFAGDAKFDPAAGLGMRFVDAPMDALLKKLELMDANPEELRNWLLLRNAIAVLEPTFAKDYVAKVMEANVSPDRVRPAFEKAFMRSWVDAALAGMPYLRTFDAVKHENLVSEFAALDVLQCELASLRIRGLCLSRIAALDTDPGMRDRIGGIMQEAVNEQRSKSLREFLQENDALALALKPCMMMSPLAAARYIDPESIKFDIVVFDEAGGITPGEAIGAILRGRQVVIVGDNMQEQPIADIVSETEALEEAETIKVRNSFFEHCEKVFPDKFKKTLRWHYRSRHESLFAFSNDEFYEGRLVTFPSPSDCEGELGVKFVYIEGGTSDEDGNRANSLEARKIAEAVMGHAASTPGKSLGVATLNARQRDAILDEIELLRKENELYEGFFDEEKEDPFFVKVPEDIHGDERDVMFISIGYGKDASGNIRMEFGPLRREGGERWLNVLATRAGERVVVFSSIRGADIDASRLTHAGGRLLKKYLEFAEAGGVSKRREIAFGEAGDTESPFEESVYRALSARGYTVHRKIGCSGHRIDLAVVDPASPGRYVLGIECDGANYGGYKTARDRDRLREQSLVGLGWKIHHVWSTDWFHNPAKAFSRLQIAVDEAIAGI